MRRVCYGVSARENGFEILPEDQDILSLLKSCHPIVFGSYIRDVLIGVTPDHLNIVVCNNKVVLALQQLLKAGFRLVRAEDEVLFLERLDTRSIQLSASSKSLTILSIVKSDRDPRPQTVITRLVCPLRPCYFECDGLMYAEERLFVYSKDVKSDMTEILSDIKKRVARESCQDDYPKSYEEWSARGFEMVVNTM